MIEPFKTRRDGMREWRQLPEGYRQLKPDELVQAGDVLRASADWFCEYPPGAFLCGKLPGNYRYWYRKEMP